MQKSRINTLDDLKHFLANALQLEHATLPPYLTALYSIKPGSNAAARKILRVIAVEEMLHMTLVANLLNAIGGTPNLLDDGFIPPYPSYLPDGEKKFKVSVQSFSEEAVKNFLLIEQPTPPDRAVDMSNADRSGNMVPQYQRDTPLTFETIGEFYQEVLAGFEALYKEMGAGLFSGGTAAQVPPEYYHSAGAELIVIDGIAAVRKALFTIAEQGEGYGGEILDKENELAHYYRFDQLQKNRLYVKGDSPEKPTGEEIVVDYSAVYPILTNPTYDNYPEGSDLRVATIQFATYYRKFLEVINVAYTGHPERLREGMSMMFAIENMMLGIIRMSVPGMEGKYGTPIFSLP